jgi:preprotein translocase subunit SecE
VSDLTKILIWVAVIGVVFAILWWKGQLQRIAVYVQQTREELKKCTWPSWEELKGSTVLVVITILVLSLFTVAVDYVFSNVVFWLSKT